jgi:hypothetical protein
MRGIKIINILFYNFIYVQNEGLSYIYKHTFIYVCICTLHLNNIERYLSYVDVSMLTLEGNFN